MIKAIIIEDEILSKDKLVAVLKEVAPEVNIINHFSSIKESIDHFKNISGADIIFCDVQLPDGLSFEIFAEIKITTPVIFITAYDKFLLQAFENNGIDYLLKPVNNEDVAKSIIKYKNLEKHFSLNPGSMEKLLNAISIKKRTRILVKRGIENISMKVEEIVLFYTENRVVYVFDKYGKKFLTDKTMSELETELDDLLFFRANRQYIINLNFIKNFKPYEKVKLQVELTAPEVNHIIIISQNSAPLFRSWIMKL